MLAYKEREKMKLYFLLLPCLLLGACTSLPKAMKDANVHDVTYAQASKDIAGHKNTPVRWGGVIIDVENEDKFSLIQALFYPLNQSGRPRLDKNGGRFVIKSTEFFDPIIYVKDREITVVGTLNGDIERMVGKRVIQVPLIESKAIHLWPKDHFYDYNNKFYEDYFDDHD